MRLGNLSRLLTALAGPIFVEPQLAMMPGTVDTFISPIRLQASFLVWLDCRGADFRNVSWYPFL